MCWHLRISPQTQGLLVKYLQLQELEKQGMIGDLQVLRMQALNDRLMLAERGFLDADGLRGRQWFKHLVSLKWHRSFPLEKFHIFSYGCIDEAHTVS